MRFAVSNPSIPGRRKSSRIRSGLETAKRIKEHHPNITIGMVTAHTEEVLARMAKEAQVKEVIPKASFNLERVQRLVNGTS